jgi:hypothetical protein
MSKEITPISPEGLEIANCYLQFGNIRTVSETMRLPENKVAEYLSRREVRKYVDTVYLDTGYRNRNQIAAVLDEIIASKLEEAQESEVYTSKDLVDLLQLAHKMRMDELNALAKMEAAGDNIKQQNNVQINSSFGEGNYGKLMEKLLKPEK